MMPTLHFQPAPLSQHRKVPQSPRSMQETVVMKGYGGGGHQEQVVQKETEIYSTTPSAKSKHALHFKWLSIV